MENVIKLLVAIGGLCGAVATVLKEYNDYSNMQQKKSAVGGNSRKQPKQNNSAQNK